MPVALCPACLTSYSTDCPMCVRPSDTPVPRIVGVHHPHLLIWGDAYTSYLRCSKCGAGWANTAKLLDLMSQCPAWVAEHPAP